MSSSTRTRATSAAGDEATVTDMNSSLIEDLLNYAGGRPVDKKTQTALDEMIIEYIDGELHSDVVRDVEALMRTFPSVARFVADRSEEGHLQKQLSMFFDGELDPETSAAIRRLIESNPYVAKQARQIRQGGDYLRVILQPIPGQHIGPNDVQAMKSELIGSSDAAPTFACFSTLIAYTNGMAVDKKIRDLLEGMIIHYVNGTLDRRSTLGLEASMRLAPRVARLIADKIGEQANLSESPFDIRHRAIENAVID